MILFAERQPCYNAVEDLLLWWLLTDLSFSNSNWYTMIFKHWTKALDLAWLFVTEIDSYNLGRLRQLILLLHYQWLRSEHHDLFSH